MSQAASQAAYLEYEDYLNDPSIDPHTEWVDGRVVHLRSSNEPHAAIVAWLIQAIGLYVGLRDLGRLYTEPFKVKLGPDLPGRSPDLLFVHRDHLDRVERQCLRGPADFIVEVLSPESRKRDLRDKVYEYAKAGVPEYWVLDPDAKVARFFRLIDEVYELTQPQEGVVDSDAIAGFWLKVDWLWEQPPVHTLLAEWSIA